MSNRGFVLISILWMLVLGSAVALSAVALARRDTQTALNGVALIRAEWARRSCEAALESRSTRMGQGERDSVSLGRGAWCRYDVQSPERLLNVNQSSGQILNRILGSDSLTDAMLDWIDADSIPRPNGAERDWYRTNGRRLPADGPVIDLRDLLGVRGIGAEHIGRLEEVFTARGDGRLLLREAPPGVWRVLPGVGDAGVSRLALMKRLGTLAGDLEPLRAALTALSGDSATYRRIWFSSEPSVRGARVEGGVGSSDLVSAVDIEYAVIGGRWARVAFEVVPR